MYVYMYDMSVISVAYQLHKSLICGAGKPQLTTELVQLFLHKNQFGRRVVPDPFPPCAGDVIHVHPVLWLVSPNGVYWPPKGVSGVY